MTVPATLPQLTAGEARELTDRIRGAATRLHDLLLEAYARGAWAALGYDSWRAYATAELSISQSHAYRLLNQAEVQNAIAEAAGVDVSRIREINATAAEQIKDTLPEVTESIREKVAAGAEPVAAVREAVAEAREAKRDADFSAAVHGGPALVEDEPEDHQPTTAEILEEQAREIERLNDLVDSLTKDDTARELVAWKGKYAQLEGRLQQELSISREAQRTAQYQADVLKKIRQALGVAQTQQILPAIRELRGEVAA